MLELIYPLAAVLLGFVVLVWSADRFIDGAAATANYAGLPPLLIGMVIVGFGTSAPEMVVSAMAAWDGNPELAVGNGLGSNIVNIALVLGLTALLVPLSVHSNIIKKELPILIGLGLLVGWFFYDGRLTRLESWCLLGGFFALIGWTIWVALNGKGDGIEDDIEQELAEKSMTLGMAIFWLLLGLLLLLASSRLLVWGSVEIAEFFAVPDLVIGLTIVALGTSLPELAASIVAARKGEHDIAIGNVVGSNMFNLLAVIGIAGVIHPVDALTAEVLTRDWLVMMALIVALLVMAYGFGRQGRITRVEGGILLVCYFAYNIWLGFSVWG
ncbi:MAG: calcium/sodium antiporter [Bacterioplanes sp.]|nr:calcium/sodium antiporter [Bacterioplanes sp.]